MTYVTDFYTKIIEMLNWNEHANINVRDISMSKLSINYQVIQHN